MIKTLGIYKSLILLLILQSQESAKAGNITSARNQGMYAAYLGVAAIVAALVIAILATGLTIGQFYSSRS